MLELFLKRNADVNAKQLLTAFMRKANTSVIEVRLNMKESLLSSVKRQFTSLDPKFTEDIVSLLKKQGAHEIRDSLSIGICDSSKRVHIEYHPLTQAQCEMLMQWPWEHMFDITFKKEPIDDVFLSEAPVPIEPSPEAEEALDVIFQELKRKGFVKSGIPP